MSTQHVRNTMERVELVMNGNKPHKSWEVYDDKERLRIIESLRKNGWKLYTRVGNCYYLAKRWNTEEANHTTNIEYSMNKLSQSRTDQEICQRNT